MKAGPDPEWEACGVDKLWGESVQEKVKGKVAKSEDNASGVKECKTSCAKDCSAATRMKELA